MHRHSNGLYGAEKVWRQLRREGIEVARCTVERLMRSDGLQGVVRGKRRRTTIADQCAGRPSDLVDRDFSASRPNELWVADFTYVAAFSSTVYGAFGFDVFARMIVGWRAATSMSTDLVLETLEMTIWNLTREGITDLTGLIHHNDTGSQSRTLR